MSENLMSNAIPKDLLTEMRDRARNFESEHAKGQKVEYRLDGGSWRADSGESFFVARQLEFMRPGIYAVQYPALKAQKLIPFNTSIDPGAAEYTATVVDQAGEVLITGDIPDDVPMVELKTAQVSTKFWHLMLGYAYSIQEARTAMFAKVPLIPQKALRTREQMERKLDDIAFLGDTTKVSPMYGLLTATGTDTYATPATGKNNSKAWKDKGADDVLADLNGPPNQVIVNTKEIEVPNAMVLPLSAKTEISNRRVGDGTSLTILKYFLENQEFIKEVEGTYKAETAGTGSVTRGAAYVKDPTRLEMLVSQPFEQLPPEARGAKVITLCHMRTAGLALYLPKSMIYFDAI